MLGVIQAQCRDRNAAVRMWQIQRRYNASVISRGIRAMVAWDWDAARVNKDTYWSERIARLGPAEGLRVADELRVRRSVSSSFACRSVE